jgi:hypothetical protein
LRLDRPETRGTSTSIVSDCIAVDQTMHYDLKANMQLVIGGGASVFLSFYSGTSCTAPIAGDAPYLHFTVVDGNWHPAAANDFAMPVGAVGVRVNLGTGVAYPQTRCAALFDHIGFGPTGSVPVMLQSFDID